MFDPVDAAEEKLILTLNRGRPWISHIPDPFLIRPFHGVRQSLWTGCSDRLVVTRSTTARMEA